MTERANQALGRGVRGVPVVEALDVTLDEAISTAWETAGARYGAWAASRW